jgi:hypothetical protein
MTDMTLIQYQPGTGKGQRAAFLCGNATIPTALFSRLLKELKGKSDATKTRMFISKLAPRHGAFLDALEKAEIGYTDALQKMIELSPIKQETTPRITKEALAVAKLLCRKYTNKAAEEMFTAFIETVFRPEFKALVIELTGENEQKFGRNAQGRIRVRPERKDLAGNAAKARAGRKKKG